MKVSKRSRLGLTAVLCVSVGAAGGIAGGNAATTKHKSASRQARSADANEPTGSPDGFRGGPGHFAVHEEAVVLDKAGKAYITATDDSGTVASVSGNDLSIKEGTTAVPYKTVKVTLPDGAKVYRNSAVAKVGDLKSGDHVHVSQSSDGTVVLADDGTHGPRGRDHDGHSDHDGHGWRGRGGPPPGARVGPPAP